MTTGAQGNAICDVVDQCRVVSAAWDQQEAGRRSNEDQNQTPHEQTLAEEADKDYKASVTQLVDYYLEATELGVSDDTICLILDRNLPAALAPELKPDAIKT